MILEKFEAPTRGSPVGHRVTEQTVKDSATIFPLPNWTVEVPIPCSHSVKPSAPPVPDPDSRLNPSPVKTASVAFDMLALFRHLIDARSGGLRMLYHAKGWVVGKGAASLAQPGGGGSGGGGGGERGGGGGGRGVPNGKSGGGGGGGSEGGDGGDGGGGDGGDGGGTKLSGMSEHPVSAFPAAQQSIKHGM